MTSEASWLAGVPPSNWTNACGPYESPEQFGDDPDPLPYGEVPPDGVFPSIVRLVAAVDNTADELSSLRAANEQLLQDNQRLERQMEQLEYDLAAARNKGFDQGYAVRDAEIGMTA